MDPADLVDGVLRSVLGGRSKRSRRASRYLTRSGGSMLARGGSALLSNPTALLTAAGVAWGIYETMQGGSSANAASPGFGGPASGAGLGATSAPLSSAAAPPPSSAAPLPPLPNVSGSGAAPAGAGLDDATRLVRLAVSAANADGAMNEHERAAVLQQAKAAGVGDVVEQELQQPRPLGEIVTGVSDPAQRATLYVLAFTILRADEQLTGAERIYLAQLANLLGLDAAAVQRLEKDTGDRIDALGDQGQLGG
jgi:uncharacterized membrane protein YebE (DUF533 family)